MLNLGFFNTATSRTHVRFQFSTHAAAGGNVAPNSAFEAADIRIYRANDGAAFSATQRSSANGITMTSPFDSLTGFHDVDIDLTDNTDAGFYASGYTYSVVLAPDETVDSQTITGIVLAMFEIAVPAVNVSQFGGTAGTFSGGRPEVNTTHAAGTAWNSGAIGSSTVANGALDLATFAADTLPLFGIGTSGTLSGTHSATTADLGTNAPGATSDVVGMTLWIPAKYFARVVTAYNTGTGVATFDSTSLTLANGDVWYLVGTAPGNAPTAAQIADQVWEEAIADHSGTAGSTAEQLAAAGAAGDPWATALPGAYGAGTAGKIVGDNLNATVSSRATQTSVDTVDDLLDTEVAAIFNRIGAPVGASISADIAAVKAETAAIVADTNEVQISLAAGGLIESMVDDLQTEVDGIQADTEDIQSRLPAALVSGRMDASVGAMAANVMTAAAAAADLTTELQSGLATAAALATVDTLVDSLVSGIIFGAAATGTLSTTQATTNLTGYAADQLIGRVVIWLTGNCEGEATDITDYDSTGGLMTFTALTTSPGNGDTFKVV